MAADGSGEPERLSPSGQNQFMSSWSSTGVIAYLQAVEPGNLDIWVLPPDGEPAPFFTSSANESHASFSPDGRWLTYVSNEAGSSEVYVRPYPGPGPATLITGSGGGSPAWSRDGRQIYFLEPRPAGPTPGGLRMMVVDVTPGASFGAGRARPLIDPWPYATFAPVRGYDVLADGTFVTSIAEDTLAGGDEETSLRQRFSVKQFHMVLNFSEELRRRATD
jgi:hypothetical protein